MKISGLLDLCVVRRLCSMCVSRNFLALKGMCIMTICTRLIYTIEANVYTIKSLAEEQYLLKFHSIHSIVFY